MLIVGHFKFVSYKFSGCIPPRKLTLCFIVIRLWSSHLARFTKYQPCQMNNGRKGGHFEFAQVKFFQDAFSSEISHFVL